jgi:hypothetical protein
METSSGEEGAMDSTQRTARLAGLAYLINGIASLFGFLCAPLMRGDATALAGVIAASGLRFRAGLVSDLIAQVSGVFLVLLLYDLFKPVHPKRAALMVVLLLVSVPISFAISLTDVAARILSSGAPFLSAVPKPQLDALATILLRLHVEGVFAVEIYWGLWLLPFGLLAFQSRFLPRTLGVLLIVSGCAYATHSLLSLLVPEFQPALYRIVTMVARSVGEPPMILWLLIKGVDVSRLSSGRPRSEPLLAAGFAGGS